MEIHRTAGGTQAVAAPWHQKQHEAITVVRPCDPNTGEGPQLQYLPFGGGEHNDCRLTLISDGVLSPAASAKEEYNKARIVALLAKQDVKMANGAIARPGSNTRFGSCTSDDSSEDSGSLPTLASSVASSPPASRTISPANEDCRAGSWSELHLKNDLPSSGSSGSSPSTPTSTTLVPGQPPLKRRRIDSGPSSSLPSWPPRPAYPPPAAAPAHSGVRTAMGKQHRSTIITNTTTTTTEHMVYGGMQAARRIENRRDIPSQRSPVEQLLPPDVRAPPEVPPKNETSNQKRQRLLKRKATLARETRRRRKEKMGQLEGTVDTLKEQLSEREQQMNQMASELEMFQEHIGNVTRDDSGQHGGSTVMVTKCIDAVKIHNDMKSLESQIVDVIRSDEQPMISSCPGGSVEAQRNQLSAPTLQNLEIMMPKYLNYHAMMLGALEMHIQQCSTAVGSWKPLQILASFADKRSAGAMEGMQSVLGEKCETMVMKTFVDGNKPTELANDLLQYDMDRMRANLLLAKAFGEIAQVSRRGQALIERVGKAVPAADMAKLLYFSETVSASMEQIASIPQEPLLSSPEPHLSANQEREGTDEN